jgi:diguanylate cyclase (GGDEF)-like protein
MTKDELMSLATEIHHDLLILINDEECLKISTNILELIRYSNFIYKGEKLNVTVSMGTTKYKNDDTIESLVDRADKALYVAKEAGKDQIISKRN